MLKHALNYSAGRWHLHAYGQGPYGPVPLGPYGTGLLHS